MMQPANSDWSALSKAIFVGLLKLSTNSYGPVDGTGQSGLQEYKILGKGKIHFFYLCGYLGKKFFILPLWRLFSHWYNQVLRFFCHSFS